MVRGDGRSAIRLLFRYNQMSQANLKTNYRHTPYWGYRPDSSSCEATYSWDFLKHFSRNSFGQIIEN